MKEASQQRFQGASIFFVNDHASSSGSRTPIERKRYRYGCHAGKRPAFIVLLGLLIGFVTPTLATADEPMVADRQLDGITFESDVLPILREHCVACHRDGQQEGGLSLETGDAILVGGDSGPAVVAKEPDMSLLLARSTDDDDPMPPADNSVGATRLNDRELEVLRTWISQGSTIASTDQPEQIDWQPIPDSFRSGFALDVSPDGQSVAVANANRVQVVETESRKTIQTLIDPSLPQPGTADFDVIQAIAFSPTRNLLATGGFRAVRLWKRQQTPAPPLPVLEQSCGPISMSPDQSAIVQVDAIGQLEIFEFPSGRRRVQLNSKQSVSGGVIGRVADIDWSCESQILVARDDGTLHAFDAANGQVKWDALFDAPIRNVRQGSDGKWIAALTTDRQLHCSTGKESEFSLLVGIDDAKAISFTAPNQLAILSGSAKLSSIEFPGRSKKVLTERQQSEFTVLACLQSKIAIGKADGSVEIWDVATAERIRHWRRRDGLAASLAAETFQRKVSAAQARLKAHVGRVDATKSRITAVESELKKATKEFEEAIKQKAEAQRKRDEIAKAIEAKEETSEDRDDDDDTELKKQQKSLAAAEKELDKAEVSLNERSGAVAKANERLTDIRSELPSLERLALRHKNHLRAIKDHQSRRSDLSWPIVSLAFSKSGESLVAYRGDGSILRFDLTSGMCIDEFQVGHAPHDGPTSHAPHDGTAILCHAQRDLPRCLLLSGQTGSARLIPIERSWSLLNTIGGNDQPLIDDRVASLDFSADGRLLAVGSGTPSRRGRVSIVDVATGDVLWESDRLHSDTVLSVRFSPDDEYLASGAADKTIRIIDIGSGKTVRALDGHTHHVLSLAWNHDGQTLVSGSADESIKVWDVFTGLGRRTIRGLSGEVTSVQFIDQSTQVVSISTGGQVRVHETQNGRQIHAGNAQGDILFAGRVAAPIGGDAEIDRATATGRRFFAVGQAGELHAWKVETLEKQ